MQRGRQGQDVVQRQSISGGKEGRHGLGCRGKCRLSSWAGANCTQELQPGTTGRGRGEARARGKGRGYK